MNELLSAFGAVGALFLFVLGVLALLTPFFVFRIRNELIKLNRSFSRFVEMTKEKGSTCLKNK